MKYCQIDRIVVLEPGKRLVGERTLGAEEEYLRDHFPKLPVMPGVMMLEALHQAAVWMVHAGLDFSHPLIVLREARSVKFGDFLSPGETLRVTVEAKSQEDSVFKVKASATKEDRLTVSANLVLEACQTGDPDWVGTDQDVRRRLRRQFEELYGNPTQIPRCEAA